MQFVNGNKVLLALVSITAAASFYAHNVSAFEITNEAGLLAALKKNKVLSEKDLDAINSEYPKLDIYGSFQFQYAKATGNANTNSVNEMGIGRANLSVYAQVSEKVSLLIEPEYGQGLPATRDAYLAYNSPSFGVFAGNHRVPFGADVLQNDINLRFVKRNLASQISPDRMVGVSVIKTMLAKKLTAQAGVWNSKLNPQAESNLINNMLADNQLFSTSTGATGNTISIKAFRVAYSTDGQDSFYTLGKGFDRDENFNRDKSIGFGFGYYNSSAATSDAAAAGLTGLNGVSAYEADMAFKYGRSAGELEYAKRNLDWWQYNPLTLSTLVASAQTSFSVQASVLVMENLSVALRKESFVYDASGQVLRGAYGQDKDDWLTIGINYYSKEMNSKIQANWIIKKEIMPAGVDAPSNNAMLIQTTTYF